MTTRFTTDTEVLDDPIREPCPIQEGTVGWSGSPEVVELGSESGDGISLVRVTLFVGHDREKPRSDDNLANGFKIRARVMGPGWRTPKRGERVIVCFPGGDWDTPGNAVILGTVGVSPSSRFGRKKTVLDFGEDDVVISAKSVSLVSEQTVDGKVARNVVSVSGRGGAQIISDGSGFFVKDGEVNIKTVDKDGNLKNYVTLDQSEASIGNSASSDVASLTLKGGDATLSGQFVSVAFFTSLGLGKNASPATPVVLGISGVSGVGSTCIWGAATP